jgi:hypothetical protein
MQWSPGLHLLGNLFYPKSGTLVSSSDGLSGTCDWSLMILALLEDSKFFNFAVEYFLDQGFDAQLPYY